MRVLFCNPNMLLRDRQQKMQYYYVGGARHIFVVWVVNGNESIFAPIEKTHMRHVLQAWWPFSLSRTRVISRIITEN